MAAQQNITVTIDNRLRIPLSEHDEFIQRVKQVFTYENPMYEKAKARSRFGKVPKGIPQYVRTWEQTAKHLTVPRGATEKLSEVCAEFGYRIGWVDSTTLGDQKMAGKIPDHRVTKRPYQNDLMEACLLNETALIRSPQGSGKTTTGFGIAAHLKLPTLIVVPTEKIFRQWVKGAQTQLGIDEKDIGIIQGKTRKVRPLTIGMQQTLRNCAKDYADVFGVVICDEAQRFAAETFFDVVDLMRARYRIGMSADERRSDGKEFAVYDVLGRMCMEIKRERLINEGAIIDAEIRIVPTSFEAPWYSKLTGLQRMNVRVQERLNMELYSNKARNELIMDVLGWCVEEGKPTVTMSIRREHCATLNSMSIARGWNSGLLLGGKDSEVEFERTEREMRDGELKQAIGTYQAVGVGFDLPLVSRGIFAAPCASSTGQQQFGQFCGRYERPDAESGKIHADDAVIYYIWDKNIQGLNAVRNIARWKPKVNVLHDDKWMPAKQYIRMMRDQELEAKKPDVEGFVPVR
jgi:superfamily II DNA or RNA helicase